MLKYKNLILIGTSHIAESSIKEIETVFNEEIPDIVAIELDKQRMIALSSKQKPNYSPSQIKSLGLKGYLFALIGGVIQRKLGNVVGIQPGSDMLKAITLASDNKKRIALIDRDIRVTLLRFSKSFKFKDKWNLFVDILKSPFSKRISFDLTKIPSKKMISFLMDIMKKRYPGIYVPLVEERNNFMAARLKQIMNNHPDEKILAVVGAGHEEEIFNLVKSK